MPSKVDPSDSETAVSDPEWAEETYTEEGSETGNEGEDEDENEDGGTWKWGETVRISMEHPGKGEDLEYWRQELGWLGEYPLRDIYHQYIAIGNPMVPEDEEEGDSDGLLPSFHWNIWTGKWERTEDELDDEAESIEPPSPVKPPKKKPCRMLWADRDAWVKD